LHSILIEESGFEGTYFPFEVAPEHLHAAVAGMRALGIMGLNVTAPHKERVIRYLSELSPEAQTMGAVNLIANDRGRLRGFNTDALGFEQMLQRNDVCVKGKTVTLIGAGGSAAAVLATLINNGVKTIRVLNRTASRAEKLKDKFSLSHAEISVGELNRAEILKSISESDLVVNTTPATSSVHEIQHRTFNLDLPPDLVVIDLAYNPLETPFMGTFRECGARVLNGLEMLIYQGIESFRIWTGLDLNHLSIDAIKQRLEGAILHEPFALSHSR